MFSLKVAAVCARASPRFDHARGKGQEILRFLSIFPQLKKENERKLRRRNEAIRVGQTREPAREKAEASLTLNVERSTSNIEHRTPNENPHDQRGRSAFAARGRAN